jgi:hypothetical protein
MVVNILPAFANAGFEGNGARSAIGGGGWHRRIRHVTEFGPGCGWHVHYGEFKNGARGVMHLEFPKLRTRLWLTFSEGE